MQYSREAKRSISENAYVNLLFTATGHASCVKGAIAMAAAFLLDTSAISETIKKNPDPNVVGFLETAEELWIPAGALLEIQMGIAKVANTNPQKAVELGRWYQDLVSSDVDIVGTTQSVIDKWATLLGDPRLLNLAVPRAGYNKVRGGQDLHIAAAALVRGLVVATYNVKDFLLINECYRLAGIQSQGRCLVLENAAARRVCRQTFHDAKPR